MTAKVKLIFGILGLIALVSVLLLYQYFRSDLRFNITRQKNSIDLSASKDQDQDGLSDAEEMIWNTDPFNSDTDGDSFKDGEEITSGHDPLKAGPDDLLDSTNATDNLTGLALAGLVEGSLKPGSLNYEKSLNDLADNVASGIRFSKPKLFTLTTTIDNQRNYENYLKNLAPIFNKFATVFADELNNMPERLAIMSQSGLSNSEIISYYSAKSKSFRDITSSLEIIKVPKSWKDIHMALMEMTDGLSGANDSISKGSKDPIKAYAALNYVGNEYANFQTLVINIDKIITQQGINSNILFTKD
ncbi:MAG: OmpA domain protein [Parcubacteria group bacterium GW2011_GWC1_39_29]|uniref:OmpA domain protein n=1 Tax=Candidatus Yanofskybacteria bacterium GW2011_GWD1_39_16 TaxID=1619030 RepID=A0A837HSZ1_9BACT|nr:MAG: OmpA domain protein [Candidatus Yanofskybacteria bacterium GW2011_GWD1_39_16]KKR15259.1 MAG: OmpA domain protein [Parcubacteria group bacterium GW2011_GWC1_39_29]